MTFSVAFMMRMSQNFVDCGEYLAKVYGDGEIESGHEMMPRRYREFTDCCPNGIDVMRGQYAERESQKNNPRFPVGLLVAIVYRYAIACMLQFPFL